MEKSSKSPIEHECEVMNSIPGKLTGYDCKECLNRGNKYFVAGDYIVSRECDCMKIRRCQRNIEKSGLKELLNRCTFENFRTNEPWQKALKEKALQFLAEYKSKWFYVSGQVGGGKTHICTAISGKLLKSGIPVRYMLWRNESTKIKSVVNDKDEYERLLNPLRTTPVLYIDDFLKTNDEVDIRTGERYKKSPTSADLSVAWAIINYRYINSNLTTIISSERSIDDVIDCDEAVGSRIRERSKGYCPYISIDKSKNYRLR